MIIYLYMLYCCRSTWWPWWNGCC